ncbi:hypothetical protein AB0O01_02520 [Streptomyces sp. NPDC093252]|uniref:hypothetical protein n=1 Tax=Streptomyces sp. NPDC093252 TaxID=3154980 RepID=UPI0034303FEE
MTTAPHPPAGSPHPVRTAPGAADRERTALLDRLTAEDFVISVAGMPFRTYGRAAWLRNVAVIRAAFPDCATTTDTGAEPVDGVADGPGKEQEGQQPPAADL